MIAGSNDPLFDDWIDAWLRDPAAEWSTNWTLVAARAKSLSEDSPECAAMIRSKLLRTHGPHGLKFRSLYQSDSAPDTNDAEVEKRRQIERAIGLGSRFIDAGGSLSRAEFDWQMSWNACVLGDAFAVRVWQEIPGVPTCTRWRIVHPARVCPPDDKRMDPKYAGGIEIDKNGRPAALWIDETKLNSTGGWEKAKPQRIPWYGDDGCPNVVHKVGLRIPGSRRGLSEFAPIIMQARMLQGVTIAYVATKRVQASHPMLLHVADVEKARQMYRGTRIENLLLAKDHQVEFPAWKFEGADYREFIDVTLRSQCAAWQIPWELVLGDHSAKSGASSRSLWQQHYQMAEREQADHANAVQRPVDESIVREIDARNGLALGPDWWANMAGVYQGPPRVMPDPQKEIDWANGMRALGMSRSTIMNRFGEDFRDEVMQDRQDAELVSAQNPQAEPDMEAVDDPEDDAEPATAPPNDPGPEETQEIKPDALVLMESRMVATIRDQIDYAIRPVKSEQKDEEMRNSDIIALATALRQQPVQVVNRLEIDASSASVMGEAIGRSLAPAQLTIDEKSAEMLGRQMGANMPKQTAPIVNVSPTPVTVQAAEAQAPVVNVSVNPTPVTVENNIEIPQRPVVAKDMGNGTVVLTPEGA